jgi:chromosome segregation ATPase
MEQKNDNSNAKDEARNLRKKVSRLEDSRSSIKDKNREKGKTIKGYQDRQYELEENRDKWKTKCKEQEKECDELSQKYKYIASLFEMKEEELRKILNEFEELKKKYPESLQKPKKPKNKTL